MEEGVLPELDLHPTTFLLGDPDRVRPEEAQTSGTPVSDEIFQSPSAIIPVVFGVKVEERNEEVDDDVATFEAPEEEDVSARHLLLTTAELQMTTGDKIVEEANLIFGKGSAGCPKVSMAFKVCRKIVKKQKKEGGTRSKSRKKKKVKQKVNVVITSRKALMAAMVAAETGQDPENIIKQLKADEPSDLETKETDQAIDNIAPEWTILDEILERKSDNVTNSFCRKLNGESHNTERSDEDGDTVHVDAGSNIRRKHLQKQDFEEDHFSEKEELYGEDFDVDKISTKKKNKIKKKKRGPKPRKRSIDDVLEETEEEFEEEPREDGQRKIKRQLLNVPNTIFEKNFQLTSMNLDDYVVKVSAKLPRSNCIRNEKQKSEREELEDDEVLESEELDEFGSKVLSQLGDRKIYGCVFCPWTGRKQTWITHLKSKHGDDQNIVFCQKSRACQMPFQSQDLLDVHVAEYHKKRNRCDICNKCFKFPSALRNHKQRHIDEDDPDKKKHICPFCGKKFSTRTGYRSHEAHNHTMNLRHICDWENCNKAYYNLSDLKIHRRGHTGECPFVCSYCGAGFVARQRLVAHEKVMHLNQGKLDTICPVCNKKIRKKHLPYHLKTHQGLTKDWCSVCGKEFPTTAGKKRHEKIHYGQKDYSCRFCGKSFVQKANMDAHERIHTGEKPYSCKYCDECFVQGTRRNMHQATCRHKPLTNVDLNNINIVKI